jgi:hypothetical protein
MSVSGSDPGWRGVGWLRSIRSATNYRGGRTRRGRELPLPEWPFLLLLALVGVFVLIVLVSMLLS